MDLSGHFRTPAFEDRVTANPQISLLNLTLDASIPGDVMWSLIDGKHIVSVLHHDGLLVVRVDDVLDKEIDGMADDFAMRMKGSRWLHWTRSQGK